MRHTLAELKREAASGKIAFELTEWHGKTGEDIPERLRGIRTVSKTNTVGITLRNDRQSDSELRLESAVLTEYDGETLTIYAPHRRDMTDIETAVLDKFYQIAREDGWYQARRYLTSTPFIYLDYDYGKDYNGMHRSGLTIINRKQRGDAVLRYTIHHNVC